MMENYNQIIKRKGKEAKDRLDEENKRLQSGEWCNHPELNYLYGCNCDRCRWIRANKDIKLNQIPKNQGEKK